MAVRTVDKQNPDGSLFAIIGDEDTVTGFLLAGVGNVDLKRKSNFLIVDGKTEVRTIEKAFHDFTTRTDISILLINQIIANQIRHVIDEYDQLVPTLLEVPSKDCPFDPDNDFIMNKVKRMLNSD